jgi:hypothetical protein
MLNAAAEEYMMDNPKYVQAMDDDLKHKLGNAIARELDCSFPTFTRDRQGLNQRSIETWVLTRDQVDAIMFTLMRLGEKLKTFEVRIPVNGVLDDASSIVAKGS